MDPERGVDMELPLKMLLSWSKVGRRLGDGDHFGLIDLEDAPTGYEGG